MNATDRMGFSPLVDACRHGHFQIQMMLKDAGGQLLGTDVSIAMVDDSMNIRFAATQAWKRFRLRARGTRRFRLRANGTRRTCVRFQAQGSESRGCQCQARAHVQVLQSVERARTQVRSGLRAIHGKGSYVWLQQTFLDSYSL